MSLLRHIFHKFHSQVYSPPVPQQDAEREQPQKLNYEELYGTPNPHTPPELPGRGRRKQTEEEKKAKKEAKKKQKGDAKNRLNELKNTAKGAKKTATAKKKIMKSRDDAVKKAEGIADRKDEEMKNEEEQYNEKKTAVAVAEQSLKNAQEEVKKARKDLEKKQKLAAEKSGIAESKRNEAQQQRQVFENKQQIFDARKHDANSKAGEEGQEVAQAMADALDEAELALNETELTEQEAEDAQRDATEAEEEVKEMEETLKDKAEAVAVAQSRVTFKRKEANQSKALVNTKKNQAEAAKLKLENLKEEAAAATQKWEEAEEERKKIAQERESLQRLKNPKKKAATRKRHSFSGRTPGSQQPSAKREKSQPTDTRKLRSDGCVANSFPGGRPSDVFDFGDGMSDFDWNDEFGGSSTANVGEESGSSSSAANVGEASSSSSKANLGASNSAAVQASRRNSAATDSVEVNTNNDENRINRDAGSNTPRATADSRTEENSSNVDDEHGDWEEDEHGDWGDNGWWDNEHGDWGEWMPHGSGEISGEAEEEAAGGPEEDSDPLGTLKAAERVAAKISCVQVLQESDSEADNEYLKNKMQKLKQQMQELIAKKKNWSRKRGKRMRDATKQRKKVGAAPEDKQVARASEKLRREVNKGWRNLDVGGFEKKFGDVVAERVKKIGKGLYGNCWLYRSKEDGDEIVVKEPKRVGTDSNADEKRRKEVAMEHKMLAVLKHVGLLPSHYKSSAKGYILMRKLQNPIITTSNEAREAASQLRRQLDELFEKKLVHGDVHSVSLIYHIEK
jgi:hypothetical protein